LIAARASGTPIVTTYHGIYSARGRLKRWYNGVMTRGDAVIANSIFTRDHILSQHPVSPDRVVVIPEGIDVAVFDPAAVSDDRVSAVRAAWGLNAGDDRVVVLMAARLTEWKGHAVILDAAARMRRRGQALFILAGAGAFSPHADELRRAISAMGLGETARIVGPCDDMPAAYLAADMLAAPSILPESFGRSVAEAGAMGRPAVASRLGGPAETVSDGVTGWLVPPGDAAAWSAALDIAVSLDGAARAAMGGRARTRVRERYSLSAMMAATFELYGRLARRRV
jgi:glycosyltransferase involved in cell wall biosynthesis